MRALNLRYLANGWIDATIEHPELGWIPYTAAPDTGDDFAEATWRELSARTDIAPHDSAGDLAIERAGMSAYRLAFEDAASRTAYAGGTLLEAIDNLLASVPKKQSRRYNNITIFERTRPEITTFLIDALNMKDAEVDHLFRLAMQIERDP